MKVPSQAIAVKHTPADLQSLLLALPLQHKGTGRASSTTVKLRLAPTIYAIAVLSFLFAC